MALLFWMWRPGNIVGPLLLVYLNLIALTEDPIGFFPNSAFVSTIAVLLGFVFFGVYVGILFVFPSGRIWTRAALWLTVGLTIFYLVWHVPDALFTSQARTLLYVGHDWSGRVDYDKGWAVLNVVSWIVVIAFLVVRVLHSAPGRGAG